MCFCSDASVIVDGRCGTCDAYIIGSPITGNRPWKTPSWLSSIKFYRKVSGFKTGEYKNHSNGKYK
jgi:hypothetical protein